MAISLRLKDIRKKSKMTQTDIAKILGITREAYGMYESGKRQVSIEVLDKLSEYYGLSIDYLVGRVRADETIESLTNDERQILIKYQKLDERGKQTILSLAQIEMQLSSD